MMKFLGFIFVLFIYQLSFAMGSKALESKKINLPYYTEQIQDISTQSSEDIKSLLNKILNSSHLVLEGKNDVLVDSCEGKHIPCLAPKKYSYKAARVNLFGDIHLEQDKTGEYFIKDIYCLKEYTNADFPAGRGVGPNLIPEHTVLNTEHVWPKYRFLRNAEGLPKQERESHSDYKWKEGDLHILYPSNSKDNSLRGNFQMGEVYEQTQNTVCQETKLGKIKLADGSISSGLYFEPPDESKGNVARVLFYFSIRYKTPIHPDEEAFIRKWHKADPVDAMEIRRNEKIYSLQNVRNPFIDMPELVDSIADF